MYDNNENNMFITSFIIHHESTYSYNATDHNCLHFGVECFNFLTKRITTPYELARDTIHPVLREACIYEYGLAEAQSLQQLTDHK